MIATKWFSWCTGNLARGCALCVQGRKLVLFITGNCRQRCFYCPVSEQRFGQDSAFANEWKIRDPENPVELFEETRLTEARGAGITGGDPLMNVTRCCTYTTLLKQRYGQQFHIHLYTPLQLVTREKLAQLYHAGLDEIRFHPNLDDGRLWHRIELAKEYPWAVGIEIPAIPGYEEKTKKLIDFVAGKVFFINLNELELSDTQTSHYLLGERGFAPKDAYSYGVAGSQKMGLAMVEYAEKKSIAAHFCTAKLKDGVQVKKRLQFRARHVALPSDICTKEGLLLRGCVYLHESVPGMKGIPEDAARKLEKMKEDVMAILHLDVQKVFIDQEKNRLVLPRAAVRQHAEKIKKGGYVPALVEEYPTSDSLEIDVQFL